LALATEDLLVYTGGATTPAERRGAAQEEDVAFNRNLNADEKLAIVHVDDEELARIRAQLQRLADALLPTESQGMVFDSLTFHLGVSISGRLFFVAEAGMDAAVDITWKRAVSKTAQESTEAI